MIPSSSNDFLVRDLAAGRIYDLCVLAVFDDVITSLTATRPLGCLSFTTDTEFSQCQALHSHFLGGTMIIIIGGIIVASVLVFIIILMIRYKVYSHQGTGHGKATLAAAVPRPQSNGQGGSQVQVLPHSASKMTDNQDEQALLPSRAMSPSNPVKDTVALVEEESSGQFAMAKTDSLSNEELLSPTKARFSSRVAIEMKIRPPSVAKEPSSPKELAGSRETEMGGNRHRETKRRREHFRGVKTFDRKGVGGDIQRRDTKKAKSNTKGCRKTNRQCAMRV